MNRKTISSTRVPKVRKPPALLVGAGHRVQILEGHHRGKSGRVVRVRGKNAVVQIQENPRQDPSLEPKRSEGAKIRHQRRFVGIPLSHLAAHVPGTPRPDPKLRDPGVQRKIRRMAELRSKLDAHDNFMERRRWERTKQWREEIRRHGTTLPEFFSGQKVVLTVGPMARRTFQVFKVLRGELVLESGIYHGKRVTVPISHVGEYIPPKGKRLSDRELEKIRRQFATLQREWKKLR